MFALRNFLRFPGRHRPRGLQCWNLWASIAWRKMSRTKQQNVKQNVTWCRLVTQQGLLKFRALQACVVYRNVTYSYILIPVDHIDHSAKCSRYQLEIKAVLRCRLILPCLVSKRLKLQHSASVRASVRIDWYLPDICRMACPELGQVAHLARLTPGESDSERQSQSQSPTQRWPLVRCHKAGEHDDNEPHGPWEMNKHLHCNSITMVSQ